MNTFNLAQSFLSGPDNLGSLQMSTAQKSSVILSEGEVLRTAVVSLRSRYCPAQQRAEVEGPWWPERGDERYHQLLSLLNGRPAWPKESRLRDGHSTGKVTRSFDCARALPSDQQNFSPRSAQDDGKGKARFSQGAQLVDQAAY